MREEFRHRPLLCLAWGLGSGVAIGLQLGFVWVLIAWAAWIRCGRSIFLAAAMAAAGFLLTPTVAPGGWFEDEYRHDVVVDVLTQPRNTATGYSFMGQAGSERWQVVMKIRSDVARGDRVRMTGWKRSLSEASESRLRLRGVSAEFRASTPPVTVHRGLFIWHWALKVRESFLAFSHRVMSADDAGMVDALAMNETSDINYDTRENFVLSGLIHYLYASGLKVFIVAGIVFGAFSRTGVTRPVRVAAVLVVLALYVGACGLTPSAMRALLLTSMYLTAYMFRREYDGLSALSIGFLYEVLKDPTVVHDPGFQLTYVCLAGLSLVLPEASSGKDFWRSSWRATLIGYGFALPILLLHQGAISLMAPVVSFVGLILLAPFLTATALAWVLSPIVSLGWVLKPFVTVYVWLAELAAWKGFVVAFPPFSGWLVVAWYGLAALVWRRYVRSTFD